MPPFCTFLRYFSKTSLSQNNDCEFIAKLTPFMCKSSYVPNAYFAYVDPKFKILKFVFFCIKLLYKILRL